MRSCLKDPWKQLWSRSKIHPGRNNYSTCHPCDGVDQVWEHWLPGTEHLEGERKREKSQGSGSTTKTAAREAAREESLSPQEYKNQWGDEQRSNCKNSNRGKHVEKRRTERMRVGGYKAQTWKEKVLSTAILAYSTSERAAFARESLTTDLETTLYIFRLSQLDFCHYTALLCMHSNLHSDFCHCSALI